MVPPASHTLRALPRAPRRPFDTRTLSETRGACQWHFSQSVGAADHVEHDLVGARPDAIEAKVAPGALDAVLLHISRAAVDLDAFVSDLDRDTRAVELGHRDLAHRILAVMEAPGRRVDHLP